MTAALPLTRAALEQALPSVACAAGDPALARVLSLPAREPASVELIEALSTALRARSSDVCPAVETQPSRHAANSPDPCPRCGGTGRIVLRSPQVTALREAWEYRGVFGPMRVGSGKTPVTMLVPTLLKAKRPILMLPASLFEKTRRDFARYRQDWLVRLPHLVSYEEMGRADRETKLTGSVDPTQPSLEPDVLVFDEAQHLFSDSGRVRKIARYVAACRARETADGVPFGTYLVCVALSGTLMTASLIDYHHLAVWCLGDRAPLPVREADAERWSAALDRDLGPLKRIAPGALETIPGGYHEWFRGRRGVVPTPGSDCDASIHVSIWRPDVPSELQQTIDEVARSGMRPDDVILGPIETPSCLAELALGFWSKWDPLPPDWWLEPRSDWYAYVRDVIAERLDGFDTPFQLVASLDSGADDAPDADIGRELLARWRAVKELFVPNPVPVWITDDVLRQAANHVRREAAIVWVHPVAAGQKLHELGVPYYGAGNNPENAVHGKSIACSVQAHREGKNLQLHSARSLVLSIPAKARAHEQLIGRQHRAGQPKGTVKVEYIGSIEYHGAVLARVLTDARADTKASGFDHKLVIADWL